MLPGAAFAQEFPALYRVVNVARDDVLNIRAEPSSLSEIIAAFGPFENGIEVTGAEANWLLVPIGERSGWVSSRFMERMGPDWIAGLPDRYSCFGTEPFWHLHVNEGVALWSAPDAPRRRFFTQPVIGANQGTGTHIAHHRAGDTSVTAFITHGLCSDGMSDATFGLRASLLWGGAEENQIYTGCCTIAP